MAVINFNCPHCRQNMDAARDLIGLNLSCPSCDRPLRVPAESDPPPKPINFDCPYCTQNIDAPPEMAGMEIPCPTCKGQMQIPGGRPGVYRSAGRTPPQEAARTPSTPPIAAPGAGAQKGSTIRIELPEALMPAETKRQVVIKRNTSSPKRRVTFTPPKRSTPQARTVPAANRPAAGRKAQAPGGFRAWWRSLFGG